MLIEYTLTWKELWAGSFCWRARRTMGDLWWRMSHPDRESKEDKDCSDGYAPGLGIDTSIGP